MQINPEEYVLKIKAAVNEFYISVQQSGAYDIADSPVLPCVPWEPCILIHGEVAALNDRNMSVYICDLAAFGRLKSALAKISLIDGGFAWPYVNLCNDSSSVEWFMLQGEVGASPSFSQVPYPKTWFVIKEDMKPLFNFTMSLLHLVPVQRRATLVCQHRSISNERKSSTIEQNVLLNMIIIHPGDVIISLPIDCDRSSIAGPSIKHTSAALQSFTAIVVQKSQFRFAKENHVDMSELLGENIVCQLEHHVVTNLVPENVLSLLSHSNQCSIASKCVQYEINRESEITIKEEPLFTADEVQCDKKETFADAVPSGLVASSTAYGYLVQKRSEGLVRNYQHEVESGPNDASGKIFKVSYGPHFSTLLQCPKCSVSFKHGSCGRGLKLLMGHVYSSHRRLTAHCTSVIRKRYAAILEDAGMGEKMRNSGLAI